MPDDAHFAPRRCLAVHPQHSDHAADLLAQAADALIAGDSARVADLLARADMPHLRTFSLRVMGKLDPDIHRIRPASRANRSAGKSGQRMPSQSVRDEVLRRDGYHCRFCGIRVVHPAARKRLRDAAPHAVPEGRSDTYHAAFLALNATWDHVIPHSAGGNNDPDNLVTTCWPCNFGRGNYTLEQMGLIDPRLHPPVHTNWDGLSRLVTIPRPEKRRDIQSAGTSAVSSWQHDIEQVHPGAARHLLALARACAPIGVDHVTKRHFALRLSVDNHYIIPIAIHADGSVNLSWSIGQHKAAMQPFAHRIASAIPGASPIENPGGWIVGFGGKRSLPVDKLLAAEKAVVAALIELREAVCRRD
ncbi:MAG: HNH endonuclease [Alphaproteobacteria bacterium]|nr:HNH endonuclease [Alphaproteobacteria bacterium]